MVDYNMDGNRFEDIDQLEIPDDDEISSSSDTEGISEGINQNSSLNISEDDSDSPDMATKDIFIPRTAYIDPNEWIKSSKILEFEFDQDRYDQSLLEKDEFTELYVQYSNNLYKILEELSTNDITRVNLESPKEEPIGLVTESTSLDVQYKRKQDEVDIAFFKVIENLQEFKHQVPETDEVVELDVVLNILQCLGANYFYTDVNKKPELLVKWINTFDNKIAYELIDEVMYDTPQPYLHRSFWNVLIVNLLIRGLFEPASNLLESSRYEELAEKDRELFSIISDVHELISSYTVFALKKQFQEWKLRACEFRDLLGKRKDQVNEEHDTIFVQIFDVACIITGFKNTIEEYCNEWYEVYVASALFQVRDDEELYPIYFQNAVQAKPSFIPEDRDDRDTTQVTLASFTDILEESFVKVLQTLHEFNPVTAATVSKFLELKGFFQSYYRSPPTTIQEVLDKKTFSEYFLIRQAYECLNIHDLVPVGIGLLLNEDICTSQVSIFENRKTISQFLPKFEYRTNDDLEWGLTICAKLNLTVTARELYYTQGLKSLDGGLLFEALNMFAKSYDPANVEDLNVVSNDGFKKVHYIVWDLIFQDSLINNRPIQDELINNLVDNKVDEGFEIHPIIRQCLSPYAVLFQLFKSLDGGDKVAAMSKLVNLLKFTFLPKKFYPLLLSQVLPFLVDTSYPFQLPGLIILIEFINNYERDRDVEEFNEGESLYKYSVEHYEEVIEHYDWRKKVDIPKDVNELIKVIRNEISAKIGQVYISQ